MTDTHAIQKGALELYVKISKDDIPLENLVKMRTAMIESKEHLLAEIANKQKGRECMTNALGFAQSDDEKKMATEKLVEFAIREGELNFDVFQTERIILLLEEKIPQAGLADKTN